MNAFYLSFALALWRASVVGLVVLTMAVVAQLCLEGRAPASWRLWVWRVVLMQMALALCPLAPIRLAVFPAALPPVNANSNPVTTAKMTSNAPRFAIESGTQKATQSATESENAPAKAGDTPIQPVIATTSTSNITIPAATSVTSATHHQFSAFVGFLLLSIYGLGWLWQLVTLGRSACRVRQQLRLCQSVEVPAVKQRVVELLARLTIGQRPRLLCLETGTPFLVGILYPKIVLSTPLLDASHPHLEAVLAHELAHLKRRDLTWGAFLWFIQAAFWFHPLVWVSRYFLPLETESACDEMVLQATQITPQSYGTLLLNSMSLETSPLIAGVADSFGALQTRLQRLNQVTRAPRRTFRVAFAVALALTFGIALPFRLVARAQTEGASSAGPTPQSPELHPIQIVSGTVLNQNEQPVAGAMVYAMPGMASGWQPLETTMSDSHGAFRFSSQVHDKFSVSVFVDAGRRGMGQGDVFLQDQGHPQPGRIHVTPGVKAKLRFLDTKGRPVPHLMVCLWRVGASQSQWLALPRSVLARMKATTNAQGIAVFPALPDRKLAQFRLGDERMVNSGSGLGDRRGGSFAPLSVEDFVTLNAPEVTKTIHLLPPIRVMGRALLGDGKPASQAYIWARRITPAEASGAQGDALDQLIAGGRTDANGNYTITGLRPGLYWVWIGPGKWARQWVGPSLQRSLTSSLNRVDFTLTHGALIQGVVISQTTKRPVKGQTMGLYDSQEDYQYAITDARGFFQFHTLGGKQQLFVHANGTNSPPPGYMLPAQSRFHFTIQNGTKREFKIEMPEVKAVTGTVVDADGKPVPRATINVQGLGGMRDYQGRTGALSDENGRFSLPLSSVKRPARLFVTTGDLATARGTIVRGGDNVTLQVEANVLGTLEGQIVDKKTAKPIQGVTVRLRENGERIVTGRGQMRTDIDGRFRFSGLRPFQSFYLEANHPDYRNDGTGSLRLIAGQTQKVTIQMHPLSSFLSGRVLQEDGKPASGFTVLAVGGQSAKTQADGTFFLPRALDEKMRLFVSAPSQNVFRGPVWWGPVWTRGGRRNVIVHLTKALRGMSNSGRQERGVPAVAGNARVGQIAPELQTIAWAQQETRSLRALRDQVVVLHFDDFFGAPSVLNDFARSFGARGVQVIGVEGAGITRGAKNPSEALNRFTIENDVPFPVALDAPLPTPGEIYWPNGQSGQRYGGSRFAVIGRDGKVVYLGDDVSEALEKAATLAK